VSDIIQLVFPAVYKSDLNWRLLWTSLKVRLAN